ncbi:MAG: hypothetical protein KC731_01485 [Myxococcales bacterium]|nr:hypothetical protein [Myxococcales bacterium]
MFEFIRLAGWGIYPVLLFGAGAIAMAFAHLRTQSGKTAGAATWLMALTTVAGVLGTGTGLQTSAMHIAETPEKWIFLIGLYESLYNLVAAAVLVAVAMLLMLAAKLLARDDDGYAPAPAE